MYNWSTDEKKFKKEDQQSVRKIASFLQTHSHVETTEIFRNKSTKNHLILGPKYTLIVKLDPFIKPAIKTNLAKTLQEMMGDSRVAVIEKK